MVPLRHAERRGIDADLKKLNEADSTTFEAPAYGNCITTGSVLIRRGAIEKRVCLIRRFPSSMTGICGYGFRLHGEFLFVNEYLFRIDSTRPTPAGIRTARMTRWYLVGRNFVRCPA